MKKLYMILIIANLGFSLQAGKHIVNFYNSSNKTITVALRPAGYNDYDDNAITLKPQQLIKSIEYGSDDKELPLYDIQCKIYKSKTISDDQIIDTKYIKDLQAFDSISWYDSSKNNCLGSNGNCTAKGTDKEDHLSKPNTLFSQLFISKLNDSVIALDLNSDNTLKTALVPLDMFDKGKPSSKEIFNDDNEQDLQNDLGSDTDSGDKPTRKGK